MALSLNKILEWCEENQKAFWEYMLYDDMQERGVSKEASMAQMEKSFDVMCDTTATYRMSRLSASGLVGAEGGKLERYFAAYENGENVDETLTDTESQVCKQTESRLAEDSENVDTHIGMQSEKCGTRTDVDKVLSKNEALKLAKAPLSSTFSSAAMVVALKMAESNACMRRIVAAPTAGACGVIPAVLIPYYEQRHAEKTEIIKALYVAAAIGQVISDKASISGAQGGCQAEIGSASAMAAGALVYLQGGTNAQICHAAALALKGLLGLVCDPVAGLVEVPCVKRNVTGTVNAIACADMAMAGIESSIPPDEVIDAMAEVGMKMDVSLRETAQGGLAATPTGKSVSEH